MDLKNKYSELLFWVLQLVGWSMLSSVMFIIPELSNTYKVYSFFTGTAVAILVTSGYRYYLKQHIDFNSFNEKNLGKIFFSFIACVAAYYLLFTFTDYFYELIWQKTPLEKQWFHENSSFLYSLVSTSIILLGWTIIYLGIKFIIGINKNKLENLELQSTLKEAQLNTLKGQVNPHFMFNSLNNIRGLMLEDVEKSREMITKLSEMLQYALSKNTVDAIALSEELEMVDNYIALAKIQMEDRLDYQKNIDPNSLSLQIPPMIIQLLVENAAKHGIANLKNGGVIGLTTSLTHEYLIIEVRNTGKLTMSENSTKLGLKNIQQRLRLLYGAKAEFSLNEIEDQVVAIIKIPSL
tara:strand:- start:43819 stop:44871 length:1053 start_codon:yes stop_codon:yes gene_type:complete